MGFGTLFVMIDYNLIIDRDINDSVLYKLECSSATLEALDFLLLCHLGPEIVTGYMIHLLGCYNSGIFNVVKADKHSPDFELGLFKLLCQFFVVAVQHGCLLLEEVLKSFR